MTCPPHHWLLETPAGRTVQGVCKHCGAERTYASAEPELPASALYAADSKHVHRPSKANQARKVAKS